MTEYSKCGHKTDGVIIMEESIFSLSAYFIWSDSVGVFGNRTICWECWCKKKFAKKGSDVK